MTERGELSAEQWQLFEQLLATEGLEGRPPRRIGRRGKGEDGLSFAQMRLWLIEQITPGSPAYNLPAAVRLSGALSVPVLLACCDEIVRRHESLRTTFPAAAGEPRQLVAPPGHVACPIADLAALPAGRRARTARRLLGLAARRPFDLERGPLLRLLLLRLGAGKHLLLLNLHHIVADAWSMGILVRELAALYAALGSGLASPLPDPPLQYADYAAWQRREQAALLAPSLDYWRRQLAGLPPALELPMDRARPRTPSHRGGVLWRRFPESLPGRLAAFAERRGVTPFMVLLAAFFAMLRRYTGSDDLAVGSPVANRGAMETEGLVGFFVNTLVLRADLAHDPAFGGLVRQVRGVSLDAYAHQDLPFERLVEELQPERSLASSPLFQVVFMLQNTARRRLDLPGLAISDVEVETGTAKFDWTLAIHEEDASMAARLEFARDLCEEATAGRALEHFLILLAGGLEDERRRLSDLPLLTATEWRQALAAARGGSLAPPPSRCLHELFAARVAAAPDAVALSCQGVRVTYEELERRSNRLGHRLRALGVGPEVRVGLLLDRTPEVVTAILGVLKAGGAYVPLDPAYPRERLAFMVEDAAVRVLVGEAATLAAAALGSPSMPTIRLDAGRELLAAESSAPVPSAALPVHLAYVIYTSGSTGRPKGCLVEHRQVVRLFTATAGWCGPGPSDVWTLFHSPAFDFSVWEIWGALLHGGRLEVVPVAVARAPDAFRALLAAQGVTVLSQTPSAFRQLVRADGEAAGDGLALRWVIFGGEILDLASLAPWFERHGDRRPRLVNMYGITETTVHVTWQPLAGEDLRRAGGAFLGVPIPDLELYLLDGHGHPVPQGVVGELYVGGAGVTRGYAGRPELTAARFVPDPYSGRPGARLYRSGDLARRHGAGGLEPLGRGDGQVKLRGFRIELGEIAAVLGAHPGVEQCVVVAREEGPDDHRLTAYLVAADRQAPAPAPADLRAWLRRQLPDFMVPAVFVLLPALPLTAQGKLDRRALPSPVAPPAAMAAPALDPLVEAVAALWAEVLGCEPGAIGPSDDFFSLGGHSLLAARLVSRLRRALGVEVPLRVLFDGAAVRDVAALAARELRGGERPEEPLTGAPRHGGLPLSFPQQRTWFLQQVDPASPLFNIAVALQLSGPLDAAALRGALREVVRRHEILHTLYDDSGGETLQVVTPGTVPAAPLVELGGLPEARRRGELRRLAAAEERRAFDLRRQLPLRAVIPRLGPQEHALLLTVHHIASDGWSQGVLLSELGALYEAFAGGRPSPLPELPVQYADFALWQRRSLREGRLRGQLEYWRGRLAPAGPELALPARRVRPVVQSFRGRLERLDLRADLATELRRLARQEGATLFMVLLAGFDLLLHLCTAQDDLLVGTALANRGRPELEGLIGPFSNLVALRTDLGGDPPFRGLLGRVRETALAAYAHQEVPFEALLAELGTRRHSRRMAPFQVAFILQNAPLPAMAVPGLRISRMESQRRTINFDLTLFLAEDREGGLRASLEYDDDLYDAAAIAGLFAGYERLLRDAVRAPEQPLSGFSLHAGEAAAPMVDVFNETL
jgi:amino acid adenylation domain-containing protein